MRFLLSHQKAKFGFRGKVIAHFAVIWFLMGVAMLITPSSGDVAYAKVLEHGHTFLFMLYVPMAIRATVWFISAGLALANARTVPERPADRVAWMALVVPMALDGFCYLWAFLINLLLFGNFITLYLIGAILYGFFVSLVLALSSWPEPPVRGDSQ